MARKKKGTKEPGTKATAKEPKTKAAAKEPEKKAATRKQQIEWRTDRPERPALYNARINGEEMPLQFKRCPFTGRSYWLFVDGSDVDPNAKVEWHAGKILKD